MAGQTISVDQEENAVKGKLPNDCAVMAEAVEAWGAKPGGKIDRSLLRTPSHGHGKLMPPWTPGNGPGTAGKPKGFIPPSEAYAICSTMTIPDLERVRKGERPLEYPWPANRLVTSGYSAMAGQILAATAGATPAAREYADRTEGPVVQRQEIASASYLIELPAFTTDPQIWNAVRSAPRLASAEAELALEAGEGNPSEA